MSVSPGIGNPLKAWHSRVGLLTLAGFALVAALVVGVSDNPVGIALLYVASTSLLLAVVCSWRTTRSFVLLLIAGLVGFVVGALLHNLLYALSELANEIAILRSTLEFLHIGFFLIAVFLCPPAVVIGAVGSLILWTRRRRRPA